MIQWGGKNVVLSFLIIFHSLEHLVTCFEFQASDNAHISLSSSRTLANTS